MIPIELNLLSYYNHGPLHRIADLDIGIEPVNRHISRKIYAIIFKKIHEHIYIQTYNQLERDLKKVNPS